MKTRSIRRTDRWDVKLSLIPWGCALLGLSIGTASCAHAPHTQGEAQELSREEIATRMEELQRRSPAYYQRIITEITRCFRPPGEATRPVVVVRFDIRRNGTVPNSSVQVVQRSGDPQFDRAALAAVECAGEGSRFGPLPNDFPWDILPILFTFRSARGSDLEHLLQE